MDQMAAITEGEWSSLSGMYTAEEADFMAQLLNDSSSLGVPSTFWPGHESSLSVDGLSEGSYYSLDVANSNFYKFSQVSSFSGGGSSSQQCYHLSDSHPILATDNSNSMFMDICMAEVKNTSSFFIEGDDHGLYQETSEGNIAEKFGKAPAAVLPEKSSHQKVEPEMSAPESISEDKCNNPLVNSKKRSRSSGDVRKNKRNVRSKKNQKLGSASNNEEDSINAGHNRQSSSSYSSEDDDSNASQETNGGMSSSLSTRGTASVSLNGKTRDSRGSATDPQILYARKRRERINERLRILQNLVPNGTKVDISTMLEEAVQYVKFLQLQIKLLSSDDLWMFSPIAYNGMDIGLDLKINPPKQS